MRHTVEIADSRGKTMQLSISVDTFGYGGSWRAIDKGMIRYNSGDIWQMKEESGLVLDVRLYHGSRWGIELFSFIGWSGLVDDEGVGVIVHPWVIGLASGPLDWSIV